MRTNEMLLESVILREDSYKAMSRAVKILKEADLTQAQVQAIFAAAADGAAKGQNWDINPSNGETGGQAAPESNRTLTGKAADVASDTVGAAWETVKRKISQSAAVAGFDAAFDSAQKQLLTAAGGEKGTVGKFLNAYKEVAEKYPFTQGAILAGIGAVVAIASGGIGGVAIVGALRTFDSLLKGDKASTALYKGAKAAGLAKLLQMLTGYLNPDVPPAPVTDNPPDVPPDAPVTDNPPVGPTGDDVIHITAQKGDVWSKIADKYKVNPDELARLNPNAFGPDGSPNMIHPGDDIVLPKNIDAAAYKGAYQGDHSMTAQNIQNKINANQYSGTADRGMAAARVASDAAKLRESYVDKDLTIKMWALNESLGRQRPRSVYITPAGVNAILEHINSRVDEGIMSKIAGGIEAVGQGVGKAAKTGWNDATNKITVNKLDLNWRRGDGAQFAKQQTVDSYDLIDFLTKQGVKKGLIASAFRAAGVPLPYQEPNRDTRDPQGRIEPTMGDEPAVDATADTAPAAKTPRTRAPRQTTTARAKAGKSNPFAHTVNQLAGGGAGATQIPTTVRVGGKTFTKVDGIKQGEVTYYDPVSREVKSLQELEAMKKQAGAGAATAQPQQQAIQQTANVPDVNILGPRKQVANMRESRQARKSASGKLGRQFEDFVSKLG